jgi:D-alanyl-lipoteichoic acid acyltransferase DltB (MBOAT superfamily)
MLFHTWEFASFFCVVYFLYLSFSHSLQNRLLLVASYFFYGSWDWHYLSLLIASTTVDYFCGIQIQNSDSKERKKSFVALSIFINLSILCVFKYYNFFAGSFQSFMSEFGLAVHPYFLDVALPLGISFYTFQTISYSIDVYQGKLKATKNYWDFALYVSFFPQLIAGPIERGTRLLPQILEKRELRPEVIFKGFYFILWGIFLKVYIADNLAKIVDPIFDGSETYFGLDILIAVYAFSIQIYCDFAGYSFIAIGLGWTMGIQLMENFRRPYLANNISDFWHRWHISLSTWLRDYLYIPLGGNQKGKTRTFINVLITMFLGGLWHGAGWTFCLFGVYHGIMIGLYHSLSQYWNRLNLFVQIILTFHIVALGWLIFRAHSLEQAYEMLSYLLFNFGGLVEYYQVDSLMKLALFCLILTVIQIFQEKKNDSLMILHLPLGPRYFILIMMLFMSLMYRGAGDSPFIYFQF